MLFLKLFENSILKVFLCLFKKRKEKKDIKVQRDFSQNIHKNPQKSNYQIVQVIHSADLKEKMIRDFFERLVEHFAKPREHPMVSK